MSKPKVKPMEETIKAEILRFYHEEGGGFYRKPNKVKTFKQFGRNTSKVKEGAITIVLELYHCYLEAKEEDIDNKSGN